MQHLSTTLSGTTGFLRPFTPVEYQPAMTRAVPPSPSIVGPLSRVPVLSTPRVESVFGTTAFLDTDGSIFVQDGGSALIGPAGGTPAAFVMTRSGRLEGEGIRGTFTLQMVGLGGTSGEFSATR